jgi:TRAP-type C4-dicarboxylate transport system substrate-binding protein
MKYIFKNLVLMLAIFFSGFNSPALLAKTIKIATLSPEGTFWMKHMRVGAKEIKQKTQGRVKFKFYPGGVMGNDDSVLRKIRIGQLHVFQS